MGSGNSAHAKQLAELNKAIDETIVRDAKEESEVIKLLLLGTAECGKSTVLKQMRLLHQEDFPPSEYETIKPAIYSNIMQSICTILEAMANLHIPFAKSKRMEDAEALLKLASSTNGCEAPSPAVFQIIKQLWLDEGVQTCFGRSAEYQLNDSAKYFLDSVDRISALNYRPSQQDVLRARVRTCGIVEVPFVFKEIKFKVYDVGGQRSERRKWIHCFDRVSAILYVVALSEYDQKLMEDGKTNRLQESLNLFGSICNSRWFAKTNMILFLNKKDIFEEKIKKTSLKISFPNYTGAQEFNECADHIQGAFMAVNRSDERKIYCYRTCGTDSKQVQYVLDSTINTLIENNLKEAGLY